MTPYYETDNGRLYNGDVLGVLKSMGDGIVQCVVTSPPYWGLRDYGVPGQLGLEETPEEYIDKMVAIFREVWRVMRPDGVMFLNMGDSYFGGAGGYDPKYEPDDDNPKSFGGTKDCPVRTNQRQKRPTPPPHLVLKTKDLVGMPWRLAFALQAEGWYLRSDIIWSKPNPMPESCTDRPTKAHEYVFLMSKQAKYYYDADAVREAGPTYIKPAGGYNKAHQIRADGTKPYKGKGGFADSLVITHGRNKRTVWTITTQPYSEAHFATFPTALVIPCIKAGTSEKGNCSVCGKPWVRVVEPVIEYAKRIKVYRMMRFDGMEIGKYLKQRRLEMGLSTIEITEKGEFYGNINHGGAMSNWENGTNIPTAKQYKKLKEIMSLDNRFDLLLKNPALGELQGWEKQEGITKGLRGAGDHINATGQTIGWRPSCTCNADIVKPIVCDPFMGSGTVAEVCERYGRAWIGIELSQEYCNIARKRIEKEARQMKLAIT